MPQPEPLYQEDDRVQFQVMPWFFIEQTLYEGTIIDTVWDEERTFFYYHVQDITGFPYPVSDGGIILEHEIVGRSNENEEEKQ